MTRQEADRSRRQRFLFSFASTLPYDREGGGGATPISLHSQLVPNNTGTHFYPPRMGGKAN